MAGTRFESAQPAIVEWFRRSGDSVYRPSDLADVLRYGRDAWSLPKGMSPDAFTELLMAAGIVRSISLKAEKHQERATRYLHGTPTIESIALSLRAKGYLTHATALALHGLGDPTPEHVFLNYEQSEKPAPENELSQSALNRAYSRPQRQSTLRFDYLGRKIVILSGKNTGQLNVVEVKAGNATLRVTDIERTLIDIVVRPAYSGGPEGLRQAYRTAVGRLSSEHLVSTLDELNYMYPFHQAIGFLLESTGHTEDIWSPLLARGVNFEFFLAHAMKQTKFDSRWRVHYPSTFAR